MNRRQHENVQLSPQISGVSEGKITTNAGHFMFFLVLPGCFRENMKYLRLRPDMSRHMQPSQIILKLKRTAPVFAAMIATCRFPASVCPRIYKERVHKCEDEE